MYELTIEVVKTQQNNVLMLLDWNDGEPEVYSWDADLFLEFLTEYDSVAHFHGMCDCQREILLSLVSMVGKAEFGYDGIVNEDDFGDDEDDDSVSDKIFMMCGDPPMSGAKPH